jgi:hypothetical protein
MTWKWSKDLQFKMDDSTGSIQDLTGYTNNASLRTAFDILDETAFGDETPEGQHGIARPTLAINGFVNTTTEGVFGPLVGTNTSVTRTAGLYNGIKWYNAEWWPSDVEISGDPANLQTWSCTLSIDGALTRTSVAPT